MITGVSRILGAPAAQAPSPASKSAAYAKKWSNGARTVENEYPQRASGTLSNAQKARLSMLAAHAFSVVHGRLPAAKAEEDAFRHAQMAAAIGKPGLRQCVQGDFKRVEAWLLDLGGEPGLAMNAHIAHETEPKRLAMAKLKAECAARGLALGYPAAICRKKYKCELDEAPAPTLWKLVFDVRMRRGKDGAPKKARPTTKKMKPDCPY